MSAALDDKKPYQEQKTFRERKEESKRIREKYVDRIPTIIEGHPKSKVPPMEKRKYLIPEDLTVHQLQLVVRKAMSTFAKNHAPSSVQMVEKTALFLFVNNKLPAPQTLLRQLYRDEANADGFLYVQYSLENSFG